MHNNTNKILPNPKSNVSRTLIASKSFEEQIVQRTSNELTNSTSSKVNHLLRTVNQRRESKIIEMVVVKISDLSPTVKLLVLHTAEKPVPISFKGGQWVDMHIPGVDTVGGFSICSSPFRLSETGELHLSVKKSDHPPSDWVHNNCKKGSIVSIQVGGDFLLDTNDPLTFGKNILLVAGGVGINPLASIVAQLQDYRKSIGIFVSKTYLIFSAKTEAELLFKDFFAKVKLEDRTFSAQYFVTDKKEKDKPKYDRQENCNIKYRRINESDIIKGLSFLDFHVGLKQSASGLEDISTNPLVYLCGPPPMIQSIEDILKSLKMSKNVLYEKWW